MSKEFDHLKVIGEVESVGVEGGKALILTATCPDCKKPSEVRVPPQEFIAFMRGNLLIQKAMPSLTDDQREMILTGTCNACWDTLFAGMDEEDEA